MKTKPHLSSVKRMDRPGLPERVADTLRQAIFDQKFKPGDRLLEPQLSKELGISRTPLREALRYLEQDGLIVREPFHGVRIASMNEDEMRKVFRIRSVLEAMAIQDARPRMRAVDWTALQEYLNRMKSAAERRDLSEFNRNDMAFHRYIWKLSGDEVLERVLTNLCHQHFIVYNVQTLGLHSRKELMELVGTHYAFVEMLKKRDGRPHD